MPFKCHLNAIYFLLIAISSAATPHVDQVARWNAATVNPKSRIALDVAVALYQRNEWRYQNLANTRPGTIPPMVIFALHLREADCDFKTNLGQGDSLQRRTVHVPKGRIPDKTPPYTWEEAAEDALFVTDHMDKKDWKTTQGALDAAESYNGLSYRYHGIPSPYLWSGTSLYGPPWGKFVSDGHYSSTARDGQLGVCAIWKWMQARGIVISFAPWPSATKE
jgi:lysozyme family protein